MTLPTRHADAHGTAGLAPAAALCLAAAAAAFALFPAPAGPAAPGGAATAAFDWPALKAGWRERAGRIAATGRLPIFDVESSYGPPSGAPGAAGDWLALARGLGPLADEHGVAVLALSPGPGAYRELPAGAPAPAWGEANRRLAGAALPCFLPVPAAGDLRPARGGGLRGIFAETLRGRYPMGGEYFFRHYPSNRQLDRPSGGASDYDVPLDGPEGDAVFAFSEEHGVPFQIHYEPEDRLFPALERQLKKYPRARVVWAHFGRVRYPERAGGYTPAFIEGLIGKYPNLYFDTSGSGPGARYKATGELVSVLWERGTLRLKPEWKALIERHPWRFLCALDLGSDRSSPEEFRKAVLGQRLLLSSLDREAGRIVAYKAAWKLVFGEDF